MPSRIRQLDWIFDRRILGIVDQAAISGASFFSMVAIGRFSEDSAEELGRYGIAFTTLWLSSSIPNALIWTPFDIRAPKLNAAGALRFERSVAWHSIAFILLMAIPIFVINWNLPEASLAMFLGSYVFIGGMLFREHVRRVLMSRKNMKALFIVDVLPSALQMFALVSLVQNQRLTAFSAMLFQGLIVMVPATMMLVPARIHKASSHDVWIDLIRNWLSGRWLLGASIVGALCDSSIRFAIAFLAGMVEQGRFTAAYSLPLVVNPMTLTLTNWLRVSVANQAVRCSEQEVGKRTLRMLKFFGAFAFVSFGLIGVFGEHAGVAIYGSKFVGLGPTIITICIGLALSLLIAPTEIALTVTGRARAILVSNIVRLGAISIVLWPLISRFGSAGGGGAWAIGCFCAFAVQYLQVRSIAIRPSRREA